MCVFSISMETLVQVVPGDVTLGKLWVAQVKLVQIVEFVVFIWPLFFNFYSSDFGVISSCVNFALWRGKKIWSPVLQIVCHFICVCKLLLLVSSQISAWPQEFSQCHASCIQPSHPQPRSTLTVPALTHGLMCSIHTDRCWYHSSTTDCEDLLLVMNSWAQCGPPVTPIPPSLVFFLVLFCFFVCLTAVVGRGGEGRRLSSELKYQIIVIIMILKS